MKHVLALIPVLSSGCVAATTYGLKTDGTTPEAGAWTATAGAGLGATKLASVDPGRRYWGGGGGLTYGLTDDVAVSATAGLGTTGRLDEAGNQAYDDWRLAEGELRWRLLREDDSPLNLTALLGAGTTVDEARSLNRVWGAHAGLVASVPAGEAVRLYGGGKINPATDDLHALGALGMTVQTVSDGPVDARFGFEGFVGHAFLYDTDPALGAGLYLSFGPR